MLRVFFALLLAAPLVPAAPLAAQPLPRPEPLLRSWLSTQRAAGEGLTRVEVDEQTERVIDDPSGARRFQLRARIRGDAVTGSWEREVLEARQGGQVLSPAHTERLEQRFATLGGELAPLMQALLLPPRLLARMQPVGGVTPEPLDGLPAWRLDVAPRQEQHPIRRVTLWFDPQTRRLLRSRHIVEHPRAGSFTVFTDYTHREGLDVPRRRRIEGLVRTRRRLRTFTVLVTVDSRYDGYRFFR